MNYENIPNVIFTYPEIASCGKTEEDCRRENISYKVGICEMKNNPRAKCTVEDEGFVKLIVDRDSNVILGVHMITPQAGEQIVEGVMSLEYKSKVDLIRRVSHFHPSFSSAFKEAANSAFEAK